MLLQNFDTGLSRGIRDVGRSKIRQHFHDLDRSLDYFIHSTVDRPQRLALFRKPSSELISSVMRFTAIRISS